jgi:hypothetical protein
MLWRRGIAPKSLHPFMKYFIPNYAAPESYVETKIENYSNA